MSDTWTRKRLLNVLGLLVLVALVVPFLIYAVPGVIGADASHVVLSGSMSPAIEAGDVVIVREVPAQTIEEGDIITFETPTGGLPTTHRVTDVQGAGADLTFQTKGDANEDADPQMIGPADVNGKVILTIPLIGHVILFAGTPLGMIVFLGLPFGILILSEAWVFAREAGGDSSGGGGSGSVLRKIPGAKSAGLASADQPEVVKGAHQSEGPHPATANTDPPGDDLEADDGSDPFTITPTDLQVSLAVTGLFFAYAAWMFYQQWFVSDRQTAIPVAVLVGTTAGFLIFLGLYYGAEHRGGADGAPEEDAESTIASNGGHAHSRMGTPPGRGVASQSADVEGSDPAAAGGAGTDTETVRSTKDLVALAAETRTPIEWRPWEDTLELAPPAEVYVLENAEAPVSRPEADSTGSRAGRNGEGERSQDDGAGPDAEEDGDAAGEAARSPSTEMDSAAGSEAAESGGEKADD